MKTYIDMEAWNRSQFFRDYDGWDFPYIVVTSDLDVTNLYEYTHKESLSFYFSLIYLTTKAADDIINFRYRFDEKGVFLIDKNVAIATHIGENEDIFHVITCDDASTMRDFARKNREKADQPGDSAEHSKTRDNVMYFSAIPWLSYTSFFRTVKKHGRDNNPKITFGKYRKENGRVLIPFSVQVHHGLMDGIHAAKLYEKIQKMTDDEIWLK